jgi:hypothetical protein
MYALCVFVVGVGLGIMRVLLVAPRLGATASVLLETPIMLRPLLRGANALSNGDGNRGLVV